MNKDILKYKPSSTEVLIESLRILSRDIKSEDGIANAVIAEAAQRMSDLLSLIDGAHIIVELYKAEGKYNQDWRKNWLKKAEEFGATPHL